jgi:hypothetical protein
MPLSSSAARTVAATATTSQPLQTSTDKYSALAELESVFSSTSLSGFSNPVSNMGVSSMGVNWDPSMRSGTGGIAWGSAGVGAPAGGIPGYAGSTVSGYGTSPPPPSYASLAAAGGNNWIA